MTTAAATMVEAALTYAARGLPVFPCKADKKPFIAGGFKAATTDAAQITNWWTQWPAAMIGMPTGSATDLHVIDVDVHSHDGFAALKKLDLVLEGVPRAVTPSGGAHLYHRLGGRALRNTAGKLGPGIDTRASGGFIITPPSRPDPTKPGYEFVNTVDILAAPLLPDEIAKLLSDTGKRTPQQQLEDEVARLATAPEGVRNDILNRAAFRLAKLVGKGLSEPAIREALTKAALKAGLGIGEIEKTLDSAFSAGRREKPGRGEDKKQGRALELPEPTPWDEEVQGEYLLKALVDDLKAFVVLSDEQAAAIATWVVHAHAAEASLITPRLGITSPVPGCGKTTLLDWLGRLTPRPLEAANVTPSAVFRTIELVRPTLLIDEGDSFLGANDELRGVLNSGHRRGGTVIRTVGEDYEPRQFATWSPCAIGLIGKLPPTLHDRSIEIALRRRLPHEKVQPFRGGDDEHELARMAARWALDNKTALAEADPELPPELVNRQADNWRPLVAIAERAGGEWPKRIKQAALALIDKDGLNASSLGLRLLDDIRTAFSQRNGGKDPLESQDPDPDRMTTVSIISDLICDQEAPWLDYRRGKPLQARQLGALLKPFRIFSRNIRAEGEGVVKGYLLDDFREAFARYLPPFASAGGPS